MEVKFDSIRELAIASMGACGASTESVQADLSNIVSSFPELLAEFVMSCLELDSVAAVASSARLYLKIAAHDLHWKPRLMRRSWALAAGGLSGSSAAGLWRNHEEVEWHLLSDEALKKALVGRAIVKHTLRLREDDSADDDDATLDCGEAIGQIFKLERQDLHRVMADAVESDLPKCASDGDGWWRRLYRALLWGQVLRLSDLASYPFSCQGQVERLFVGRNADWSDGWIMRFLNLESGILTIGDGQAPLARLDLSQNPMQIRRLHGQEVRAPMYCAALRWPEDVRSGDGSPLVASSAPALRNGEPCQWSFTVVGFGVDVLLRANSESQREAWIERINIGAQAVHNRIDYKGDGNVLDLEEFLPGGAEWNRLGMGESNHLLHGLYYRLAIMDQVEATSI